MKTLKLLTSEKDELTKKLEVLRNEYSQTSAKLKTVQQEITYRTDAQYLTLEELVTSARDNMSTTALDELFRRSGVIATHLQELMYTLKLYGDKDHPRSNEWFATEVIKILTTLNSSGVLGREIIDVS